MKKRKAWSKLACCVSAGATLLGGVSLHTIANEGEWDTAGFVENATHYRDDRGISKSRTTAQYEFTKSLGNKGIFSDVRFSGTLRGSYDAVYDLNADEFGDEAGGSRNIENQGAPWGDTPWGESQVLNSSFDATGNPGGWGFDLATNPNEGLIILGEAFHNPNGGMTMGVPVRPCDVDSRGCGLKDYLDYDTNDLRFSEFNSELDFIRELYLEGSIPFGDANAGRDVFFRVGKQQVIWGRSDLFRVLDVINPVDYSRHNIYDELEDIRITQWIATAELRLGPTGIFDDLNVQAVWNFDKFRPNNLGQAGSPYAILDAGSFFRGMNNCWENGCSVSNFAGLSPLVADPAANELMSADFAPGVIGIRQVNMPDAGKQGGIKLEGVYNDIGFSFNYYHFYQQLPILRGNIESTNPFTGEVKDHDYLIAFDIDFPEVDLFGASVDFYADSIKSVFRVETAYTQGEEFANSEEADLYSDSDMFRWVLGWDRDTFIPFLNEHRAFIISAQVFGEHMLDHVLVNYELGESGIPNWKDNYTATLLIRGRYLSDTLSPQLLVAHDYKAGATTISPSIDWMMSDNWRFILAANIKFGDSAKDQTFDDCRACNPYPPFTATSHHADPMQPGAVGFSGIEPLGRFRAGPLGMASEEDEIQLTIRYRF